MHIKKYITHIFYEKITEIRFFYIVSKSNTKSLSDLELDKKLFNLIIIILLNINITFYRNSYILNCYTIIF